MAPLTFRTHTARLIESPSWQQIESRFAKWDTLRRGIFILADTQNNYVQTTGAEYKATVEFRQYLADGTFAHCVLGHKCATPVPTAIFSCVGTIHLNENEIFKLPEIMEIFRSFFDNRTVPESLVRRDITAKFARPTRG
jgi:hypothetical protein